MALVTLERFPNAALAHIVKGFLEDRGLQAVVIHDTIGNIPEITGNFLSGILLQVDESRLEEARQLFTDWQQEFTDEEI